MGGIMKGGHTHGHMHMAAYISSRRWNLCILTAVILTLVFGCGILGIHRLRDARNVLSLLINERDDQILSLRLLLQKEREQMQDVIKEREEMKMRVYNLGGQKLELNSKISDLQSTISSLRDELATIETAFQEKQNETKDLNRRVESLTETLQQKEKETEDLKHRLQLINASNHSDTEPTANGRSENFEEISGENGRASLERDEDNGDRKDVATTDNKGGVKLEIAQEKSRAENLRIRGKGRSYLRRSNGKRWRVVAKQIQGKSNNKLEERKPIIQLNDSVAKDQRFTIDDSEQGKTKVQLRDYIEENNIGENSTKPVAVTNSSTVLEEKPNYSANKSGGDGSSNTGKDIVITESAKNKNYGERDDNGSQGEKEVAEKLDVKMENFEASDEERDEPDQF